SICPGKRWSLCPEIRWSLSSGNWWSRYSESPTNAVGGDKVGIKLSPFHPYGDILFDNPADTFTYLIGELNNLDFAYVELMKRSPMFPVPHYPTDDEIEFFGKQVKHALIANSGYDKVSADAELKKGIAKVISFGTLFLANPDLPQRFENNASLNQPDRATMFGGGAQGYIDYPFLNA
ncbi:NADH:flavin oxidoreductase / NADH oxidase family protein, partial [Chryseolinea serpens]